MRRLVMALDATRVASHSASVAHGLVRMGNQLDGGRLAHVTSILDGEMPGRTHSRVPLPAFALPAIAANQLAATLCSARVEQQVSLPADQMRLA